MHLRPAALRTTATAATVSFALIVRPLALALVAIPVTLRPAILVALDPFRFSGSVAGAPRPPTPAAAKSWSSSLSAATAGASLCEGSDG